VNSILVDRDIVNSIDKMSALAPLHNPPNLQGIRSCMKLMPGVPQVAVFDTAFHATMPEYAYTYALPLEYRDNHGVRRYGFHGTSHKYVARQAQKILAERGLDRSKTRIITAHLGNGCSMAAIVGGKVVDTSMGMTPAEGLVMGTRSGDLDPAILLFLARELGQSHDEVDDLINKKSGLLGVSGKSSDMRDIESSANSGDAKAELALEIFCYRITKYIGAYTAAMGGVDAVVFTGGIGENCSSVRARVMNGLGAIGLELDSAKNDSCRTIADLSKDSSPARILLIPTNEERMIARETVQVVSELAMAT
jgi:acetate kinase